MSIPNRIFIVSIMFLILAFLVLSPVHSADLNSPFSNETIVERTYSDNYIGISGGLTTDNRTANAGLFYQYGNNVLFPELYFNYGKNSRNNDSFSFGGNIIIQYPDIVSPYVLSGIAFQYSPYDRQDSIIYKVGGGFTIPINNDTKYDFRYEYVFPENSYYKAQNKINFSIITRF